MKKITNSTSNKYYVDSVAFARKLWEGLKQCSPKLCYPTINPQYNEISLINCPSEELLLSATEKAINAIGWRYNELDFDFTGYNAAAVKGERFVYLSFFYNDYEHEGYINISYPNSNVEFEEWY